MLNGDSGEGVKVRVRVQCADDGSYVARQVDGTLLAWGADFADVRHNLEQVVRARYGVTARPVLLVGGPAPDPGPERSD
jgi:hypothetical protein